MKLFQIIIKYRDNLKSLASRIRGRRKKKTAAVATVLNPLPVFSCNTHASACMAEWPASVFLENVGLFAEVSLEQALESLAVSRLVACHFMNKGCL